MGIRSDRSYRFEEPRAVVWEALTQVGHYRAWWPWLRQFDGERFTAGERWRCVVKAPLPYSLRFEIELVEVAAPDRARAELTGDIAGRAEIALSDEAHASTLRLMSDLTGTSGLIGALDRFVRPVAAFGHDWVLDNGIRQFRAAAFV